MNLDRARADLVRALDPASPAGRHNPNFRDARDVLIAFGCEAIVTPRRPGLSVDDLVRLAEEARPSEARRAFAVLLVDALGTPGLLPDRGEPARRVQSFLERALLNPLRRAGYDFDGTTYDKRQALTRAQIDRRASSPVGTFHSTLDPRRWRKLTPHPTDGARVDLGVAPACLVSRVGARSR